MAGDRRGVNALPAWFTPLVLAVPLLELRDGLGTTIVVVTHELASILSIGNNSIYLDAETHTMIATGNPQQAARTGEARVRHFLSRGEL